MTSEIVVKMPICDRSVRVRVTAREDGDMDVEILSDCPSIDHYAATLGRITMDDITGFEGSRINREDVRGNMSMICLAPIAVYQAAWLECGMMSRRIYGKTGPCTMGTPDVMDKE